MKKHTKKRKKRGTRRKTQAPSKPSTVSKLDAEPIPAKQEAKPRPYQAIQKRESEKRVRERRSVLRYFGVASRFLRESKTELKKVKWPTRKELLASTAMVIFLVVVVSLFLGIIDFGLIKIIKNLVG
ncbi:MAG: preprotein translocase subunit SecE [Deltaproteobacteria bacterium]|nr:MAG: preprotein translocase subunit SecE [Deltaproteobacteria bacterium]